MRDAVRPDLAACRGRVAEAARGRGLDPATVLSAERLSHLSGVEPARVAAVVAGTAPEVPLERRAHPRFLLLRAPRRDEHGREWPLAATAEDFGAPGASLGPLDAGTGLPRLGHAAGVQRCFGVEGGFLLEDLLAREGRLARLPPPVADAAPAAEAVEAPPAAEADTADAPHGPDREHPR
ncbi:hypothetical protein ACIA8H_14215 [Streptomyces goshikiensis]|uniref:hypothetical protein n=1 Tax=Streptomyces goshikiensis TaxID=1942 RepID=UPI0037A774D5